MEKQTKTNQTTAQKLVKELKRDMFSSENQNVLNSDSPPASVPTCKPPDVHLARSCLKLSEMGVHVKAIGIATHVRALAPRPVRLHLQL